jgi:hypothetical protein
MTTPQDKAAHVLKLADGLWEIGAPGGNARRAAEMLREYAALIQAQAKVEHAQEKLVCWASRSSIEWLSDASGGDTIVTTLRASRTENEVIPLYTLLQPAQAKVDPITGEQMSKLWYATRKAGEPPVTAVEWFEAGVHAAERHHGILPKEQP